MAKSIGTISLHVFDLQRIKEEIELSKYPGGVIKLIDTGNEIIIRGSDDFRITQIIKHVPDAKTNKHS